MEFYNFLKYKPTCFLDKSIHLNNKTHLGIPVLSPEKCPQNIDILLIRHRVVCVLRTAAAAPCQNVVVTAAVAPCQNARVEAKDSGAA